MLRQARKRARVSQTELAAVLGTYPMAISLAERGFPIDPKTQTRIGAAIDGLVEIRMAAQEMLAQLARKLQEENHDAR